MNSQPITLTDEEIKELTGYARPAYQLRVLKELGIQARKRPDNSVLVLRMHCMMPAVTAANDAPKLRPIRK
ncbi:MAG: hypothetical protein JWP38_3676 [Herbaspirillum sp.]|nr:hypothetical protein [Herbaspirillum sp.]